LAENIAWIVDLAATRARKIALKQRLEHQHERVTTIAFQFLLEYERTDLELLM
jgi:hypothetical protein